MGYTCELAVAERASADSCFYSGGSQQGHKSAALSQSCSSTDDDDDVDDDDGDDGDGDDRDDDHDNQKKSIFFSLSHVFPNPGAELIKLLSSL